MAKILGKKLAGNCCLFGRPGCSNRLLFSRSFSSQLFVSRLSYYTTDEELRQAFSPFGEVTEARLVRDGRTQRPKGFGFVTYESEAEAQKALKAMDGRLCSEGGDMLAVPDFLYVTSDGGSYPPNRSYCVPPEGQISSIVNMPKIRMILAGRLIFVEVAKPRPEEAKAAS